MNTPLGRRNSILKERCCSPQTLHFRRLLLTATALLLLLSDFAFADFPPVLVIDWAAYPKVEASGTSGDYASYTTPDSVFVLHGSTGVVSSGTDMQSALANVTGTGSWDGGLNISLAGHDFQVPQVLVYYSAPVDPPTMQGYDGGTHSPAGVGAVSTGTNASEAFVVAYNGLPEGYIFKFGDLLPVYRYQAGPGPVIIHSGSNWPPSNVFTFPLQLALAGSGTLAATSYSEGFNNGYWCNEMYQGTGGNAELFIYIDPSSATGTAWGEINGNDIYMEWDSSRGPFLQGATLAAASTRPGWAPPQVEWDGVILPFKYFDSQNVVYGNQSGSTSVIINLNGSVTAVSAYSTFTGNYDPSSQRLTINGYDLAAVDAHGTSFLGIPPGIVVVTSGWSPGMIIGEDPWSSPQWPDYSLYSLNGTVTFVYCWYGCSYFHFSGGSPIYGGSYINAVDGWPTGVPDPPILPTKVMFNGEIFSGGGGSTWWGEPGYLYAMYSYVGSCGDQESVAVFYGMGGNPVYWNGSVNGSGSSFGDPVQVQDPSGPPSYGPPAISVNGVTIPGANCGAYDIYLNASREVNIDGGGNVTDSAGSIRATYDPTTLQFSDAQIYGIFAKETIPTGSGNGLVVFGRVGGQSIQLGDGSYRDASNTTVYVVHFNDGSIGIKYVGIPEGSLFVVKDGNGNYTSPVYRYSAAASNQILNTGNGWPVSNIYPRQIYVNGHYAALNASGEYDWNGDPNGLQQCGACYHVQPGGETISVSFSGSDGSTAVVSGTYSTFGAFTGGWNGAALFTGLVPGLVISINAPSYTARYGPPKIQWDGLELTFDPIASSVCPVNPSGSDVYHDADGLGLRLTIDGSGHVIATNDTGTYNGTYDPLTHHFTFSGTSPGVVNALSSQGFLLVPSDPSTGAGTGPTLESLGNLDVQGNVFSLGTWMNCTGSSVPGFSLTYFNVTGGSPDLLQFAAARQSVQWVWSHAQTDGSSTQLPMMHLDSSNRLSLYNPQTSGSNALPTVVVDPSVSGTSRFPGTLTAAGLILTGSSADTPPRIVLDPNGTATINGKSILTQTAADALYLPSGVGLSASNGRVGIGTANPQSALDVNGSANIGQNLAISGAGSLTLPDGTVLSGSHTLQNVVTSGTALTISGCISASQVSGLSDVATNGNYSSLNGRPTIPAVPTNVSAFINDAGYIASSGTASKLTLSGTTNITSQVNISGPARISGGIVVTGTAIVSGTTTKIVASGTNQLVLIPEQGDLSMGGFTAGPKPQ